MDKAANTTEVAQVQNLPCPNPDHCALAVSGQSASCKPYGRLNVLIDLEDQASQKKDNNHNTANNKKEEDNKSEAPNTISVQHNTLSRSDH